MMTISHADSEISDGTPPEFADSRRAGIGFYKNEIFTDRGDKNRIILPKQAARKFGREDSDALGRFIAWGIAIYNLDILPETSARKFGREDSDALGRFITWGIAIYNQVNGWRTVLSDKTIHRYRSKQGGARQLTLGSRRAAFAALTPLTSGAACGNPWSSADITPPTPPCK